MVCGIGRIGQSSKLAVLIGIAVACIFAAPVQATDTVVQSIVNSGTQPVPALALPNIPSTVNITTLPFQLQGTVVNLSQIRVYIDDVFSVTIPLAQGMTTFSDNLVFSQGTHVVKLVGISPYANISPTVSFTLTYTVPVIDPPAPNEPSTGGGTNDAPGTNEPSTGGGTNDPPVTNSTSSPTNTTSERFGGATISQRASATQLEAPLPAAHQQTIPDWLYGALVALDVARPGTTTVSWPMVQRFVIVTAGLSALLFTSVLLGVSRQLFYSWAGRFTQLTSCSVGYHSKGYIRGAGLALILLAFFFV